ncbi:hypothetical protein HIM_06168 [Hirsutella minnesotensis 3608]|uniref:G domain-containing protein n=1 Tax=Hirsutella minnesotensis 3608 TaxID=1043627 RepID=A0A0F7ZU72_9HYPO|nr:hypothetical protein HIM_06168 [Hirsutella minnesotensis 3608]
MADIPIPSVEAGSLSSAEKLNECPYQPPRVDSRAPRVTLTTVPSSCALSTPDSSQSGHGDEYVSQDRRPSPTEQLSRGMQQVQVSSPDLMGMNTVVAAIDNITAESSPRPTLQVDRSANRSGESSSRRSSRARRSSSRSVLVRHEVVNEEPPQDVFNEPRFQDAFHNTKRLMANLATELESSSLHNDPDSVMHRLRNETRDLAGFQCPTTRTVAFVGDSGTGKSSLLNSLLDVKDLARASSSGTACTCVATEYHFHQFQTLTVQVELFGIDELSEQLRNMLHAYRQFHFMPSVEMSNTDAKTVEQLEKNAALALDTFRSMFRGSLRDEAFLLGNSETNVLERLRRWTETLFRSESEAPRPGLTVESCSALLATLSSDQPSSNEPAIWPCIRKIKVFLDAHILSKGLVLVDLPGLRDLNSTRRNVTERFLRYCDEIFVTCNIDRATTDQGVRDVFDLARPACLSRVGIICTKSDVRDAEEARKDYKGEPAQQIRRRMTDLDVEAKECNSIEEEIFDLLSKPTLSLGEQDELNQLNREKIQAGRRKDKADFELTRYIIETRNDDVTQSLVDSYGPSAPTGEVAVFCVSNKLYWANRDKASDDALPYLHLSRIMAVRRHCIGIVSSSQQLAATDYMRHKVPALLAQVQLWVQSGTRSADLEMRQELCSALNTIEAWLRRKLMSRTSAAQTAGRVAKLCFDEQLYNPRDTLHWSQAAQNAGWDWHQWAHQTYSAFCRQYGIHCTKIAGRHNWNEEIIAGMVQDVNTPWNVVRTTVRSQHGAIIGLIEHFLGRAMSHLERQPDALWDVVLPLQQALENRLDLAMSDLEQAYMDWDAKVHSLKTDALTGIRTSFMGRAMEDSYRKCNLEYGRGSHDRRREIIRRQLAQDRLFTDLMREWRRSFRELADQMQDNISGIINSNFTQIQETLDIVRRDSAANEGEMDAAFRDRVNETLIRAQAAHQGTLEVL